MKRKIIAIFLAIVLLPIINVQALKFDTNAQDFKPGETKSISGGYSQRVSTVYSCVIESGKNYFTVKDTTYGCSITALETDQEVTAKIKITKEVIGYASSESSNEKTITINKNSESKPGDPTPPQQSNPLQENNTTKKRGKNITAFCICHYNSGKLECDDDCSEEVLLNKLKLECRNGNLDESTIEYTCTGTHGINIGKTLNEACDLGGDSGNSIVTISASAECEAVIENIGVGFCEDENIVKVFTFLGYIVLIAKILVPILIIALATFDLYRAVVSNEDEELGNQIKVVIRRIITGILIFLIPTIVKIGMSFVNNWKDVEHDYEKCLTCVLEPGSCLNKEVD